MLLKVLAQVALFWLSLFPSPSVSWVPASASSSTSSPLMFGQPIVRLATRAVVQQYSRGSIPSASSSRLFMSTESRKAGVASPEELRSFVEKAGDKLMVVDVRNPDAAAEPGDQKSLAVASLPSTEVRPKGVHLIWDRTTDSMPLPPTDDLETPIITHCGGGGRGQLAKDYLLSKGFVNVLNGGGPKETDCWAEFGDK